MKKTIIIFFGIFLVLFILEFSLRIAGAIFLSKKSSNINSSIVDNKAIRIMFIGDSWAFGSDAAKGHGYADVFLKTLSQKLPNEKIQIFNYAYPSSNSAQCLYQFLDHYETCKPHILVILMGINNGWNTVDVDMVRHRINYILNINQSTQNNRIQTKVVNGFNKLRIVKLFKITYYNLVEKPNEHKVVPVFTIDNSFYVKHMLDLFSENADASREYLISEREEAKDYEHFFRLMMYTFSNNLNKTKEYINKINLYKPYLLRKSFYLEFKNQDKYVALRQVILLEHLNYLRLICDTQKIYMVLQTYPFFSNFEDYNEEIRFFTSRYNITCVDQARYFNNEFTAENRKPMFNKFHPNDKGHFYMGMYLARFFMEKEIIDNLRKSGIVNKSF